MENMQNSWVISDTMNLDAASASESLGRTSTRKKSYKKAKNNVKAAKAGNRKRRGRAKSKELTGLLQPCLFLWSASAFCSSSP